MTLSLYNTLSRRKDPFAPIDPARVRLYVCGPTVYDRIHIGNARPLVVFDVLARLLRHEYGDDAVTYVRNITDVDDKIIERAAERGVPIEDLTRTTTERFHADAVALGCRPPDVEPRATDHIAEMIALVGRLIAKGHAYATDNGEVLFDVPSMPDYGRLSGRNRDEMIAGARVEVASHKRDPADFVLWKPSRPDQPGWDSPWSRGRPGWHLECSAMSEKYLGPEFDIHGGGVDLVFPHHENEIAQSVCDHPDQPFAHVWMHNGYLMSEGEKMSKSLGNFYTVEDLLGEFPGEALRVALLKTHYRQPLDFTKDGVREAKRELDYLYGALRGVDPEVMAAVRPAPVEPGEENADIAETERALADDLNTPLALSGLHALAADVYRARDVEGLSNKKINRLRRILKKNSDMLGILQLEPEDWFRAGAEDGAAIDALVDARNAARRKKDFAEADRIRGELDSLGIVLEDGPNGTVWRRAG
jgi:cysteinyl-tRNA synthetase